MTSPARCLAVIALLLSVTAARPAPAQEGSDDPLLIEVPTVTLKAGETADAIVTIVISSGYSMLASPPPTRWTTGAVLAVESSGGVIAKTPVFPEPEKVKEADGGMEIHLWKGAFDVRVPLEAMTKATPGEKRLHGRLRYQLHSEGSYYKIKTREIEIPVKIVKRGGPATRP